MVESSFESIADRLIILRKDDNSEGAEITIRIGRPYWLPGNKDAACAVEIVGLYGRTRDIVGVDPIHALKSAIKFAESLIAKGEGNQKFYWPDGEPYNLD